MPEDRDEQRGASDDYYANRYLRGQRFTNRYGRGRLAGILTEGDRSDELRLNERGEWVPTHEAADDQSTWYERDDHPSRRRRERDWPEGAGPNDLIGGGYYGQGRGYENVGDRGEHHGKGPRGYRRTDARILEEVSDRLTDDPGIDASEIEVQVAAGEVTLEGQVGDRRMKHRAENLAAGVRGVHDVRNHLRVVRH